MPQSFAVTMSRPHDDGDECPSVEELAAFSSGRMAEERVETVCRHLSKCTRCEERVAHLTEGDPLAAQLSAAEACAFDFVAESECQRMQQAANLIPGVLDKTGWTDARDSTVASEVASTDGLREPGLRAGGDETATYHGLPTAIGGHRITGLLGEGTFGRVYLAIDEELGRQVAVKVPKFAGRASPEAIDQFLLEARTAAQLKHPGIVTVYEVGRDGDAGGYIVMEYVEGGSLKKKMAGGRLSVAQAVKYVAQAAAAIHYAHKRGLVHRDLKPGNLLIDSDGQIKVADFGLALAEAEQREHANEYAGTSPYMSPEQVRGEAHRLDGRTDIWSLGVILYELLTGRRPFRGDRAQAEDEILHRAPKPPRQIDDTIPVELESACLKCLAKDPRERYLVATDLVRDLSQPSDKVAVARRSSWRTIAAVSLVALVLVAAAIVPQFIEPSYSVDKDAQPFVPLALFYRQPRELFPSVAPNERWNHDPSRDEVWLDTPNKVLIGLGETELDSYRLQVDISQMRGEGGAGIFLGYQERAPLDGKKRWIMETITFRTYLDGKSTIEREMHPLTEMRTGFSAKGRTRIAWQAVPPGVAKNATLEVTVQNNRLVEVRWMGAPLPDLVDLQAEVAPAALHGQFGLFRDRGATTFHRAKFISQEYKP